MEPFNLPPLPEPRKKWRRPDGSTHEITPAAERYDDLYRPPPDDAPYHPPIRRTLAKPQGMSERQAIAFLSEYSRRLNESLRLFEPLPDQKAFFDSPCHTRILLGGNRCLGGETEIYDPVAGVSRPIAEIDGPFHVLSRAADGSVVIAEASAPFVKAVDRLYRFTLSNGESFVATMRHRVLAADGQWVSMQEAAGGLPLAAMLCDETGLRGEPLSRDASAKSRPSRARLRTSFQSLRKSSSHIAIRSSSCLASRLPSVLSAEECRISPCDHTERLGRTREMRQSPSRHGRTPVPIVPVFLATENSPPRVAIRCHDALAISERCFCTRRRPCRSLRSCWILRKEPQAFLDPESWPPHLQRAADSGPPVWRQSLVSWAAALRRVTHAYERRCFQTAQDCLGGCFEYCRHGGEQPRLAAEACRSFAPSRSDVQVCSPSSSKSGDPASKAKHTRLATQFSRGMSACDCGEIGQPRESQPSTERHLVVETCEYLRTDLVYDITVPVYHNYIHAGVASHNSGKTVGAAVLVAKIVCNVAGDRYPKKGTLVMVAKDRDTLANTIWKKLFCSGPFKTIKDPDTGLMRAFRPHAEWDMAHASEARDAEPLIPARFYSDKDIAWQDRRKGIPHSIRLNTGWEILFYSGESDPKPGFIADVAWIDEELQNARWGVELVMRLIDRRGCLIWSATPENSSELLLDLHARAEAGDPDVGEWSLCSLDNPHLDATAREQAVKFLNDPNLYDTKIKGVFSLGQARVFSAFSPKRHCIESFCIPDHWTKYVSIDPGIMPTVAVFVAVPPPSEPLHGPYVYVYDELRVMNADTDAFAAALKKVVASQRIERYLLDYQRARVREMDGSTILQKFLDSFRKYGIESERQGSSFTAGTNDPEYRRDVIKEWLNGERLRLFGDKTPFLQDELRRHTYKRDKYGQLTNQVVKRNDHEIDSLGYCLAYGPKWVAPPAGYGGEETLAERLARKARWQGKGRPSGISFGPGGAIPK